MRKIRVLIGAVLGALSLSVATVGQAACTNGASFAGSSSGCYSTTHDAYVILGIDSNLNSAAKTISYNVASTGGLGTADTTQNNISVDSGTTAAFTGDSTSISFVENGNMGIRANAPFTLTISVPVIGSDGGCTPAFIAQTSGNGSVGVSSNFTLAVSDVTDNSGAGQVAGYSVNDAGTTDSSYSNTTLACVTSGGSGTGYFTVELSPTVTTEYNLRFDIGFETDGARDADLDQVGADGEPAADTYEMTLGLSAAAGVSS